jgi:hypothetical protein
MGKEAAKVSQIVRDLATKIIEEADSLVDLDAQGDYNLKVMQSELGERCVKAETRVVRLEIALESIRRMTEELANSKYAKAAKGSTLGAEIHRIATEALNR